MKRLLAMIAGSLLFLMGTISMVTPIPGGTFMLASGSMLLICASPWFRRCLLFLREKFSRFNRVMIWMEDKMPDRIGSVLKLTTPGHVLQPGDHGTENP